MLKPLSRHLIVVALASGCLAACDANANRPSSIDLLVALPSAERRSAGDVDLSIYADVVSIGGSVREALVMQAPARSTWTFALPRRAVLSTSAALVSGPGVTLRFGISNGRTYQSLEQVEVGADWRDVILDLRDYSEWKFSLFHQPLDVTWRLTINADATPGGIVALERPTVATR